MTAICPEHGCELVWAEASDHGSVHDVAHCDICLEEKGSDCKLWSPSEYYEDFIVDDEINLAKENRC